MAVFAVDSKRQSMVATGIVEPVTEWGQDASGKRFRTDVQATDEASGLPLWGVEVTYRETSWGRESTSTAKVSVPVNKLPNPGFFTPISFTGLKAEVRMNRSSGVLSTVWSAEGIDAITAAAAAVPAGKAAEGGK